MNFVNLKYFMAVVQEMSFSKAAQKLYLSQQALSGHIHRLEEECGTQLFERSPKLRLTYAGVCVAKHAAQILDLEEQMVVQLSDIANLRSGHLSVGTSHTRGRVLLPDIIPAYLNRYPTIELTMHTGITQELEGMLIDGSLDLLVGFPPFHSQSIQCIPVRKERLCLVVPKSLMAQKFANPDGAAAHFMRSGVDIAAFCDMPFVMMKRGRVHDMAFRYFSSHNITPNIILQHSDLETLLGLCLHGAGLTFSFESSARKAIMMSEQNKADAAYLFFFQDSSMETELVIAYNNDRYLSRAANDFILLAQEVFTPDFPSHMKRAD